MRSAYTVETRGPSATPPESGFRAWYTVIVCLLLMIVSFADRNIINLMAPAIQHDLRISDVQLGILTGPAFGLAYTAAIFPLAWLGDRTSIRKLLFACTLLWSFAAIACGFAHTYEHLLFWRMAVGVGEAALSPAAILLISSQFRSHELATPLSVFTLGTVGGFAVAMGGGGLIASGNYFSQVGWLPSLPNWSWPFILTGAPGLLLAPLVLTLREPPRRARAAAGTTEAAGASTANFTRSNLGPLAAIICAFGMLSMASAALGAWIPTYFIRSHGWSISHIGYVFGLMLLVLASIGKLGSGMIIDRAFAAGRHDAHLRYPLVVGIVALPLAALFAMPGIDTLWVLVGLGVYLLLIYPSMGYASALIQIVTPAQVRGRMIATYIVSSNIFGAIGPFLVGILSGKALGGGIGPALAILCATSLSVSTLLFWRVLRPAHALIAEGQTQQGIANAR